MIAFFMLIVKMIYNLHKLGLGRDRVFPVILYRDTTAARLRFPGLFPIC